MVKCISINSTYTHLVRTVTDKTNELRAERGKKRAATSTIEPHSTAGILGDLSVCVYLHVCVLVRVVITSGMCTVSSSGHGSARITNWRIIFDLIEFEFISIFIYIVDQFN